MNKLALVKLIVFLLTGLLATGFCLLAHKIAKKNSKSNPKQEVPLIDIPKETSFSLKENETISQIFSCNEFLCLVTHSDEKENKIYVIQPATGKKIHTLIFSSARSKEEK